MIVATRSTLENDSADMLLRPLVAVMAMAAVLVPASQSYAATPLPAPRDLHATHVSDTSADFVWLHDGLTAQDVVERRVNGVWREFARTNAGFLPLTNLTPAVSRPQLLWAADTIDVRH